MSQAPTQKEQRIHSKAAILGCTLALAGAALVACNDNSSTPAQPPQLEQASNWVDVFERRTCVTVPTGGTCLGQTGFHVDPQGLVATGPEFGPIESEGTTTEAEGQAVITAANAVAEQDLVNLLLTCEVWVPGPGENGVILRLRDSNSASRTVLQRSLNALQLCYRGDKAKALALFAAVDPLIDKYAGSTPTPTPTETPTSSPSPSPSPSPTPTMTVSPTPSPSPTPTGTMTILPNPEGER